MCLPCRYVWVWLTRGLLEKDKQLGFLTERRIVGTWCESPLADIAKVIVYKKKHILSMWVVITVLLYRIKSVLSSPLCKVSPVSNRSHGAVVIALPLLNLYGYALQNSYSFLRQRRCHTFFI